MPVYYSPIPRNVRLGLAHASGSLFGNNRTGDSQEQNDHAGNEVVSHLPLQMLLYFNGFFFPFWWISAVFMLELKFDLLKRYYQCLLVAGMVLLSIFEGLRLYLGYMGNLKEKVPELAGFWLVSFLFQLPILLFFLTDEGTIILPLERAVHAMYLAFVIAELLAAFLALRALSRTLSLRFHRGHFGPSEDRQPLFVTPAFATPYRRTVLPVTPAKGNQD